MIGMSLEKEVVKNLGKEEIAEIDLIQKHLKHLIILTIGTDSSFFKSLSSKFELSSPSSTADNCHVPKTRQWS